MSVFADEANISKSMLSRWIKDQANIFRKSSIEAFKAEDPLSFQQ